MTAIPSMLRGCGGDHTRRGGWRYLACGDTEECILADTDGSPEDSAPGREGCLTSWGCLSSAPLTRRKARLNTLEYGQRMPREHLTLWALLLELQSEIAGICEPAMIDASSDNTDVGTRRESKPPDLNHGIDALREFVCTRCCPNR